MSEQAFWQLAYTQLLNMCPRDTHNMVNHITLEDRGDAWVITISGPTVKYDYAKAVNYGLSAKANGRTMSVKEQRNYMWIERALAQAAEVFGEVRYEIQ